MFRLGRVHCCSFAAVVYRYVAEQADGPTDAGIDFMAQNLPGSHEEFTAENSFDSRVSAGVGIDLP